MPSDVASFDGAANAMIGGVVGHQSVSGDHQVFLASYQDFTALAGKVTAGLDPTDVSYLRQAVRSAVPYMQRDPVVAADLESKNAAKLSQAEALVASADLNAVSDPLSHLLSNVQSRAARTESAELSSSASSRTAQLVLGLVAAFAAMWLGLVVSASITRPLAETVEVLDAIAEGDLTRTSTVTSRDEMGAMATALNRALSRMRTRGGRDRRSLRDPGEWGSTPNPDRQYACTFRDNYLTSIKVPEPSIWSVVDSIPVSGT